MLLEQLTCILEEVYDSEVLFKSFDEGDPKLDQIENGTAISKNIRRNEQVF